jgi:hypothetical protein
MKPPFDDAPRRLETFLFAPADARSAAIMRLLLAGMLAWAFESTGLHPMPPLSILPGAGRAYEQVFLTGWYRTAVLAAIVLLGIGWRPRMMGLILLAMLVPLASLSRGQQSRQVLLMALLSFSMLRSDAKWSLRTLLGGATAPSAGPMWPIRLMQIQLSIVYLINVIAKSTPEYLSGDLLVGMSRMRPNFLVNLSDGYLHVSSMRLPVAWAAIGSVIVEAFLAIGFWFPRLRWFTAIVGVAFHLVLQQIVRIFMLDFASMFLYIPFLLKWENWRVKGNTDKFLSDSNIGEKQRSCHPI